MCSPPPKLLVNADFCRGFETAGGGHNLALDVYTNQPWHRFYLGGGKAEHLFDNYSMSQIFPWPGSLILTNHEGTSFRARKYCHVIIKKVHCRTRLHNREIKSIC
jgi:hypothetical protein